MKLAIATAIDRAYLVPLLVMLRSLCDHLSPRYHPTLFLSATGLAPFELDQLNAILEVKPVRAELPNLPLRPPYTPQACFPLLLPSLFPEQSRILFVDADMLFLEDVSQIWEVELGGRALAAVADMAIPTVASPRGIYAPEKFGIPPSRPYFNAGLMLVDLDRWRELQVVERAMRHVQSGRLDFLHQEALNIELWNDWLALPRRWNLIGSLAGRRYGHFPLEAPAGIHFAGAFKPWLIDTASPFQARYTEVLLRVAENRPRASWRHRLAGCYDRYLRDYLYPLERFLWRRRLL